MMLYILILQLSTYAIKASSEDLPGNLTDFTTCKVSHMGLDFLGHIGKTESKVRCQGWSSNTPHKVHSSYTDNKFPEFSKEKAKNYCRNPSKNINGPWCYTTAENLIDETCAIPLCTLTECRLTGPGVEYAGEHNYVSAGNKCLKWSKDRKKVKLNGTFTEIKKFSRTKFPEETVSDVKKRCRNPDGDIGGPWCFVELEDSNQVEKQYCDIPFCDDQDCMVFTKNHSLYSHYTTMPEKMTNFTFGVKIWDPDAYIEASARLVLTLLPLPITGKDLNDLGIGIEILLTNKVSALTYGNKDKPEYMPTSRILQSTEYTFFSLSWDRGFITLNKQGYKKPIFLQEIKTKDTLLRFKKDQFNYWAAQGTNIMWSFPFCDDDEDCDIQTTTSAKYQQFWPLRESETGRDLHFFVRAVHSANILFVSTPVLDFPYVELMMSRADNFTRVICVEYAGGPKILLKETTFVNLISYWKFSEFSISLFADTFYLYWKKDVGNFIIITVKHRVIKQLRWYSPSSEKSVAHWSFFCPPPQSAYPKPAFLPECSLNQKERNYIGSQDITSTGLPCLPWATKKHVPQEIKDLFKGKDLFEAYNYCRDPKNELKGTYCYTISEDANKRVEKQFCHIRKCKSAECKMAGTGNDYLGKLNTTRSNRTCQYWIAQIPLSLVRKIYDIRKKLHPNQDFEDDYHDPVFRIGNITDAAIAAAMKGSHKITINNIEYSLNDTETESNLFKRSILSNITTEDVSATLKNVSDTIKNYIKDTVEEMSHVKVHNVELRYLNGTLYADMSPEVAKNYCRNPSRSLAGSWCYTMDPQVTKDACFVPDCDRNEECTVFIKGKGHGRELYVLPQWKETGIHGGIRFSVKQWNPDIIEGIQFEIYSFKRHPKFYLLMGDENNDRVKLIKDNVVLKEKTLPHLIPAGKWNSFWLQLRQGELQLGFEGVPTPLFEWHESENSRDFEPIYLNFRTLTGNLIGLFFKCDDCHTENTTTKETSKIMPINVWTVDEQITYKNLTLHIRGKGKQFIKLFHLPGSGENYVINIENDGKLIKLIKNMKHLTRVAKQVNLEHPALTHNSWTLMNVSFNENELNITSNKTLVLNFVSTVPMLFYYFSMTSEEGWVTWTANCDSLDIDGPPLDGGWSKWSPWECTVTCGGGEGFRTRTCSNPRPNIYGHLCEGSATSTGKCNDFVCGDISDETIDLIREHLQSTNFSNVVDMGKTVSVVNYGDILTRIAIESPDSYYEWSLNGRLLETDSGRIHFIGDDVIIKNVSVYDAGVYICLLYRTNKQRLVVHVATLAVKTKQYEITTRATLPLTIQSKALSLGYVYSDLKQKWLLNGNIFMDYGVTNLAAVSFEHFESINESFHGEWMCLIEQTDLKLAWVTNIIKIEVKKKPNIYTHLMEDAATKHIFGRMKYDSVVAVAIIVIVGINVVCVAFGLIIYLRFCRLPDQYKNKRRKKNKKRNRRF